MLGSDNWSENYGVDILGDTYGIIYADPETDTVKPYYESEDYFETLQRVQSWYEKGYIYKDASITEDSGDTLMANGVTFSYIATGQVGIDDIRRSVTGYDVVASQVYLFPMGSSVSQTWGLCIPVTCQEPEAAAKFIDLLYSDADVMNLLTWGIEGRDYTVNEEGEAVKAEDAVYSAICICGATVFSPTRLRVRAEILWSGSRHPMTPLRFLNISASPPTHPSSATN